ncbi:ribonuclease H-like domain-containing protein [Tanacetum coccineum]
MFEVEPIPPTSSVTALRIPMIKKGEYDHMFHEIYSILPSLIMILWGYNPPMERPRPQLDLYPRQVMMLDARTLWLAIKARFGGNEASKKMQKNLLKQQFETFTIGSREELDSAYERFQHILSMLELYDAKVSLEDANLKFLRSLPSVWHVVATMIRGQPGLDELEFDDLYNNLKVYEHELKGVSTSSSQNIAFLSTEVKGSTLKQSTADPDNISKGYTQATSSKVKTAPNYDSHSDEIICSFFSQQASMPTTHDDEDLLQIDEDAMEEIDIRWQVAMITARIRKFMRKTGRPIDLKPKNGITFDKSKIECFNCQKLGHFARECRFAKYQENRANGRQEKRIVAIEDSNSKALVATDNNDDIDWTKEFDAEPMHFGQDGLGDFDWSNTADDTCESYKQLLQNYQTKKDNFQKARSEILGYQMSLESLEVIIKTHEKNEYAWGDKYEQMEYDLKLRDLKLEEKQKELDQVLKERDDFKDNGTQAVLLYKSTGRPYYQGDGYYKNSNYSHSFTRFYPQGSTAHTKTQENYDLSPILGKLLLSLAEKRRMHREKRGKESANSTLTLSTANTPSQSTPVKFTLQVSLMQEQPSSFYSDDDIPKDGVFSTNSFDDENTDNEEDGAPDYNNMDHTIDHCCLYVQAKTETNNKISRHACCCFYLKLEPKKVSQALAMKVGLKRCRRTLQFQATKMYWCVLCDLSQASVKRVIGTKWVFRNKMDDRGTIIKNKARLVAQGYRQEECVDYDEVFAPVARIEAIRLFLAFASFMGFIVYQMDVKSAFLYGNITEEVYVKQPPGFEDPAHPNKVYKVVKALYGLHQIRHHLSNCALPPARQPARHHNVVKRKPFGLIYYSMILMVLNVFHQASYWDSLRDMAMRFLEYIMGQFGITFASALVGLATNQKFNFYLMIMNGMLGHIANGKPFLMYPRFIQLFFNKQLEGVTKPQNFLPSITLPFKVFTFMRKNNPKFSGRITPLTPPMLEVITALAAEEAHSESTHSRAKSSPRDAQGTPTQSAAQASILQGTADFQDVSPNMGGDEGLLDLYALNREVRRLKKQNISQAKQIHKLKAKLKKLSKGVKPLVKHHIIWVKSQKLKKRGKKQKKKVSSVKLGRNKDEGNLSEEHHDQDDHNHTAFVYKDFDATDAVVAVTPDLERKSDETEHVIIEEEKDTSDVKSGDTEELDLERIQSPSSPTQEEEPEEQFKDDEFLADIPLNISRPRGLSIPSPMQSQPQQPTQTTDPKEKGKGILVEEPKKKKLTLQQIRALETAHDEEVARKWGSEWDAEEERKRARIQEFTKAKVSQRKELYVKVQKSSKDSKGVYSMGSEKDKEMLQEMRERCKETLRKRKVPLQKNSLQ